MKELEYPFDGEELLRRKKSLRKALLSDARPRIKKRIAVLADPPPMIWCGCWSCFLLNQGIEPEFYESEYNRYYEDGVFGTPELDSFRPDLVYIHTTCRNIRIRSIRTQGTDGSRRRRSLRGCGSISPICGNACGSGIIAPLSRIILRSRLSASGKYGCLGFQGTGKFSQPSESEVLSVCRGASGFLYPGYCVGGCGCWAFPLA